MKRTPQLVFLIVLGCVFLAAVVQLFRLRFEHGDVYPAYSSLRADPLGTMVLYESLRRLPGLEVTRDYSAQNRLPEGPRTTFLHLAARSYEWTHVDKELLDEVERFVVRGGRLVIAFYPEGEKPYRPMTGEPGKREAKRKGTSKKKDKAQENPPILEKPPIGEKPPPVKPEDEDNQNSDPAKEGAGGKENGLGKDSSEMVQSRWGLRLAHVPLKKEESSYISEDVQNVSPLRLPDYLEWHSAIVITNASSRWKTIYARQGNPVLVERTWGAGSVVVMTDSYPLSNESLGKERHTELLAWLIAPGRTVMFDESHLGVAEQVGVSGLMLKYRLYWVAASLLLLAGLYIWKSSVKFVPPLPPELPPGYVAGKDSSTGFLNLLRRNISPKSVLRLCFEEWKKSVPQGNPHWKWRVERANELLEQAEAAGGGGARSLETYREICRVLKSRTPLRPQRSEDGEGRTADEIKQTANPIDL